MKSTYGSVTAAVKWNCPHCKHLQEETVDPSDFDRGPCYCDEYCYCSGWDMDKEVKCRKCGKAVRLSAGL